MHNAINRHTAFNPVNAARQALTTWMLDLADDVSKQHKIGYEAVESGNPESFDGVLLEYKLATKFEFDFRVWAGASDNTIYTSPAGNHAFRFVHDVLHATLNADFTVDGEIKVALHHIALAEKQLQAFPLAIDLLKIDTLGQLEYFQKTGGFVENQLEFVMSNI